MSTSKSRSRSKSRSKMTHSVKCVPQSALGERPRYCLCRCAVQEMANQFPACCSVPEVCRKPIAGNAGLQHNALYECPREGNRGKRQVEVDIIAPYRNREGRPSRRTAVVKPQLILPILPVRMVQLQSASQSHLLKLAFGRHAAEGVRGGLAAQRLLFLIQHNPDVHEFDVEASLFGLPYGARPQVDLPSTVV